MHLQRFISVSVLLLYIACTCRNGVHAESPGMTGGQGWSEALPYYNRGNRYMNQGRYEDALHDYQEAVTRCSTDSDFFVNLGTAYEKCADFSNAQKSFEKAIALNKEDWSAYNNLANSLTKQDKLAEAIKAFEEALKRKPPSTDAEAINKDIGDIKKIMEAKGISTTSGSQAPVMSKGAQSKQKPRPVVETKRQPEHHSSAKIPTETPAAIQAPASAPAPAPAAKKTSDWGY
ncbi:MAG: tetratricopeptide repeat protein [Candidatus Obscuribacterales bacterium]|nr:tetratricopeptide repeat protein [Candidatus Obscuribacterales bacterium]